MKRSAVFLLWLGVSLADVHLLRADWLVMKGGHTVEVVSVEVTETAVTVITLTGRYWSMLAEAVDVPATLEANQGRVEPGVTSDSITGSETPSPRSPAPPPGQGPDAHVLEAPAPPAPHAPSAPKAALFVNGVVTTSAPLEFAETRTFELFREDAFVDAQYTDRQTPGMEIGGVLRLEGPLGVRGSVELFRSDRGAAFEALLPHPFFFERFREVSGNRSDLSHEETALHLGAVLSSDWGNAFFLDVWGGPSLFITRTELLVDVLYREVYPFDAVTPLGAKSTVFDQRVLGFNVGASAAYRVAGPIGVDFGVRFSQGRVEVSPAEGRVIEFYAGGLRAAAGLRFFLH